jgi:antirestriction protein ArdC
MSSRFGWATYRQWQKRGAQVRKDEKSASVFFWKNLNEGGGDEADEEQTEVNRARFVARAYHVFNADQVEGYTPPQVEPLSDSERIGRAEAFFAAIPAERCLSNEACYLPEADCVNMPPFSLFRSAGAYYGVLGHELTHWTGAKKRLDRDLAGRFGSEAYAMEELVAELGSAFVAGRLALPLEPRKDHAPYIASWLKVLKNDPRAIFTAATRAQAAADYLAAFNEAQAVAA